MTTIAKHTLYLARMLAAERMAFELEEPVAAETRMDDPVRWYDRSRRRVLVCPVIDANDDMQVMHVNRLGSGLCVPPLPPKGERVGRVMGRLEFPEN